MKQVIIHICAPTGEELARTESVIETAFHKLRGSEHPLAKHRQVIIKHTCPEGSLSVVEIQDAATGVPTFGPLAPELASFGQVTVNPLEPLGSVPWVRFSPGYGWSVYDFKTKGKYFPNLQDAIADYNARVDLAVKPLNVYALIHGQVSVETCPGYGDALTAFHTHEKQMREQAEAFRTPKEGCLCGNCEHARGPGGTDEAAHGIEGRSVNVKPPASFAAVLAMLAGIGGLAGLVADVMDDDDARKEVIDGEGNPQVVKLLRESGLMREIPGPFPDTVAGIVAIPRVYGEQFANDVEKAIRDSNPTALLVLLSGAGLVD